MPPVDVRHIVVEISISAPKERVWTAMLSEMSEWWPSDFLGYPESQKIRFEPFVGGRLYEETPSGQQLLWGTVLAIDPNRAMEFAGHMTPSFGGPAINMNRMEISEAQDGSTLFRLTNAIFGVIGDGLEDNLTQGWNYLFGALKSYVEAKAA